MDDFKETLNTIVEVIKHLSLRVDALEGNLNIDTKEGEEIHISSLKDAEILLDNHRGPSGAAFRKQLVASIIRNDVRERPELYHNYIVKLSRCGEHKLIIQLCDYLLTMAPFDRDILSDAIDACGDTCNWELGIKYLSRAKEIPMDKWNDKLFISSVSFLTQRFSAFPNNISYFEEALHLADEYIHYFKHDEHGYNLKADILLRAQRRQEARDFLLETIRNGYSEDIPNDKNRIVAAQCCSTLLDLLDDSCDYDLIIEICNKGLRYQHAQASTRISSLVYRRALAYDAKAYAEKFENTKTILIALAEMQSAYTLVSNGTCIADEDGIIEQKYEALRRYAGDQFTPLIKRPLSISET